MLQNQRPTLWTFDGTCKTCKKSCYKIKDQQKISTESTPTKISTESSWRFLLKKSNICLLDIFSCEGLDFVARMNLPCQIFLLCKVLDFVESKILVWRAEVDLVMIFFVPDLGALYRIGGSSTPP